MEPNDADTTLCLGLHANMHSNQILGGGICVGRTGADPCGHVYQCECVHNIHIWMGHSHLTRIKHCSNSPGQYEKDQFLLSDRETEVRGLSQVVGILCRSLGE